MSAMSQPGMDFIRIGNAQWQGRDLVAAFQDEDFLAQLDVAEQAGLIDPDFEFRLVGPEEVRADIGHPRRGVRGLIREWREWLLGWEEFRLEFEEPVELGDGRIFQRVRARGRSRSAGAELESRSAGIYTFRDGKLMASRHYLHEEQALEDAGLRDGP
jgi:ketosteroid isomerase-like protein